MLKIRKVVVMKNKEKYKYFHYKEKKSKRRHVNSSTYHHFFAILVLICILIFLIFYIQKNFSLAVETLFIANSSTDTNEITNTTQNITSSTLEENVEKASHADIDFSV